MQVVFVVVFSAGDVGQVVVFRERARLLNQKYQHHYVHEQKIFFFSPNEFQNSFPELSVKAGYFIMSFRSHKPVNMTSRLLQL